MSGVYKLEVAGTGPLGDFWENVFHYELEELGGHTSVTYAAELIDTWRTALESRFALATPDDSEIGTYTCKRVSSGGGLSVIVGSGSPGTEGSDTDTTGVAADMAWLPAGGYNRIGHTYKCPAPADGVAGDQILAAWKTKLDALAADMLTPLTLPAGAGSATFGIFSRKTAIFHHIDRYDLRPKLTYLNKRSKR